MEFTFKHSDISCITISHMTSSASSSSAQKSCQCLLYQKPGSERMPYPFIDVSWTDYFGYSPTTTRWTTLDQSDTISDTISSYGDEDVRGVRFSCRYNDRSDDDDGASLSIKKESGTSTQPMLDSRKFTFSTDNMSPVLWLRCRPHRSFSSSADDLPPVCFFAAILLVLFCCGPCVLCCLVWNNLKKKKQRSQIQLQPPPPQPPQPPPQPPQPPPPFPPPRPLQPPLYDQVFNAPTAIPVVYSRYHWPDTQQPSIGAQQPLAGARQPLPGAQDPW